jgi:DNA-binding transcriptional MerR regulator
MLSISEFAAATQLTPKALRLYDECDLLRPATISPAGYRFYSAAQVRTGRLVRSLRDMHLSLRQVAQILSAPGPDGELLLTQFLREAELQYARERRAYQSALLTLRSSRPKRQAAIEEHSSEALLVSVWAFTADRTTFVERCLESTTLAVARLEALGIECQRSPWCALIEPLTEEEGPVELLLPLGNAGESRATGITTRLLPRLSYAAVRIPDADPGTITAALDGIFDWFDRQAATAIGPPQVGLNNAGNTLQPVVRWAFESSH